MGTNDLSTFDSNRAEWRFNEFHKSGAFTSSGIQGVVERFWENQLRIRELACLPQAIFKFGRLFLVGYFIVCSDTGRDPHSTPNAGSPSEPGGSEALAKTAVEFCCLATP
jgi:hypothetical protein